MIVKMIIDEGDRPKPSKIILKKYGFKLKDDFKILLAILGVIVGICLLCTTQDGLLFYLGGFISTSGIYYAYIDYADTANYLRNASSNKPSKTLNKYKYMKKIAITQSLLIISICICGYIVAVINGPNNNQILIAIVLITIILAGQIFNIITLRNTTDASQKSLFGLYIERKKLEEKKKIETLNKKT